VCAKFGDVSFHAGLLFCIIDRAIMMHPAKRQKLDAANSTLTKPFRSPLRVRSNNHTDRSSQKSDPSLSYRRSSSPPPAAKQTSLAHTTVANLDASAQSADDEAALQKEYTVLARRLTNLRQALDTAQQAVKIQRSKQSSDIDALTVKWRSVVRDTAEELFEDAKARFEKEGGLDKWLREQEKEPPDLWFEEQQLELTEAQREMLEMRRQDERAEAEKYGLLDKVSNEEDEEQVTVGLCFIMPS
jgi:Swi5-dependent recombination DNA repair protein 1